MTTRTLKQVIPAVATQEGAGVTVHRTIGMPVLKNLDPFLLLDHFSSADPDDYIAGFPDHPHRGFITFTYMLDGHMQHHDSMGNEGDLQAGGAQWMKAASGVIHSEMPKQRAGLMRGFQLWINLPAAEKMSTPAYQEFSAPAFPVVEQSGTTVKVLLGEYAGESAPIHDLHTQVQYLDITLQADTEFEHSVPPGHTAFLYVFEGSLMSGVTRLARHTLAVTGTADSLAVRAGERGARFILVSGKPLGEPIVQYGPFVMSSRAEIEQAFSDYRAGTLVRQKADIVSEVPD
ncbi:MAG: pirin family protein [Granulosicoccaceae bacterium]|jgi:redox-sensitive bicupin YhaK (pirin superfamily)